MKESSILFHEWCLLVACKPDNETETKKKSLTPFRTLGTLTTLTKKNFKLRGVHVGQVRLFLTGCIKYGGPESKKNAQIMEFSQMTSYGIKKAEKKI